MGVTYEEFIEGFKKYVEDYGYKSNEIRPLKNWMRDYLEYLPNEENNDNLLPGD